MGSHDASDVSLLLRLDRAASTARERVVRFRRAMGSEDEAERRAACATDPFAAVRDVSTLATIERLRELDPSASERPWRDGLVRWSVELLQERVGLDLFVAETTARFAPDPDASRRAVASEGAARLDEGAPKGLLSVADAERALVSAPDEARAQAALERLAALSAKVSAARKERRARRFEAARRLGLTHPFALATAVQPEALVALATELLRRTDPLSEELLAQAMRSAQGPWTAAHAMQLWLARSASHGWPASLHARWLRESFAALTHASNSRNGEVRLPKVLGGASFLRAAYAWGFSFRARGVARGLPFALAADPYPTSAHRFGCAFAATLADPLFQRRVQGVSPRLASAQSRALRASLLFGLRTMAVRLLFAVDEQRSSARFEELGVRLFGAPLPPALLEVWPAFRVDDLSRFVAALTTHTFTRDMVHRFDEDWFRNPRAGTHLSALACAPMFDDAPIPEQAPDELARAFEEALG